MRRSALIIFFASTVGVILADVLQLEWLHSISKPLIMTSILFYYLASIPPGSRSRPVILAITFSFAGDVLLMKNELFIPGLIAFLLAHLCYIFAYRQHRSEESENSLAGLHKIRLAFPVVLAATGLVIVLYPTLNDLKIPVMIYSLVIAVMVINALLRLGKTSNESFWLVFAGAAFFFVSDSILALDKFLQPIRFADIYIMTSYCAAQLLIILGLIRHARNRIV